MDAGDTPATTLISQSAVTLHRVGAFCFARNAKHGSAHHSLKSPACSPVSCSCTLKSRLTFSANRAGARYEKSGLTLTATPSLSSQLSVPCPASDEDWIPIMALGINLHVPKLNILSGFSGDNAHIRCSASLPHSHNVHMRCSA